MSVGKFKYAGTNSKGVVKLRRSTNQTLEEVEKFLTEKQIGYDIKRGATCVDIVFLDNTYQYFWTTGRWGAYENNHGNSKFRFPQQHYHSESIEHLYDTFLEPKLSEPVVEPRVSSFKSVWQPKEKV